MLERTRLLGPELIQALERSDEVLSAHDGNKQHKWKTQDWKEHASRAIAHLANAILDKEDGAEIEASHGAIRALMALQKIIETIEVRKFCASHAKQVERKETHASLTEALRVPSASVERGPTLNDRARVHGSREIL